MHFYFKKSRFVVGREAVFCSCELQTNFVTTYRVKVNWRFSISRNCEIVRNGSLTTLELVKTAQICVFPKMFDSFALQVNVLAAIAFYRIKIHSLFLWTNFSSFFPLKSLVYLGQNAASTCLKCSCFVEVSKLNLNLIYNKRCKFMEMQENRTRSKKELCFFQWKTKTLFLDTV